MSPSNFCVEEETSQEFNRSQRQSELSSGPLILTAVGLSNKTKDNGETMGYNAMHSIES
jgi:hypothetical protein